MKSGRGDQVDAALARDLRQLRDVAARVAGHAVDHCAAARRFEVGEFARGVVDRGQQDFGKELRGIARVDDDVLVGVAATQDLRRDVPQNGADEAHGRSYAKSQAWAAAPRTPAWSFIFEITIGTDS